MGHTKRRASLMTLMMTTATMPIYADDADDADGHNMARMSLGRIEQQQNCV